MNEFVSCPVPPEQRPLEEFQELTDSWFFAWPVGDQPYLSRSLTISWMLMLPLCILIASGSWTLRADPPRLVVAGAVAGVDLRDETFARGESRLRRIRLVRRSDLGKTSFVEKQGSSGGPP